MNRKTFKDTDGAKGTIGSVVRIWTHDDPSQYKTVKLIQSRGRGGTVLYFEGERGGYPASSVYIVDENKDQ